MNLKDFFKAFKKGLIIWIVSLIVFYLLSSFIDRFLKIPLSMVIVFCLGAFMIGLIIGVKFTNSKPILLAISVQGSISVLFGTFMFGLTKKEEFRTILECSPLECLYWYSFQVLLWIGFSALGSFIGKKFRQK
jgi:hypothetical protein